MKPVVAAKNLSKFDPKTFLSTMDDGRKIAAFPKKQLIFVQGDLGGRGNGASIRESSEEGIEV